MTKAKRYAKRFTDWLFEMYRVPRIPVIIKWHHTALVTDNGKTGFGMYLANERKIFVAAGQIGLSGTCSVIAHEFVHYVQALRGRNLLDDDIEEEAERIGKALYGIYLTNRCGLGDRLKRIPAVYGTNAPGVERRAGEQYGITDD